MRKTLLGGAIFLTLLAHVAAAQTTPVSTSTLYGPPLPPGYAAAASGGYWGAGQKGSGDCDPTVAKHQDTLRRSAISDWQTLASRTYSTLPSTGFTGISCIDSLLNSSLNIFGNSSLDDLLAKIEQGVCNALGSVVAMGANMLMSPVNQALNGALPIGQIIPGVDLGSLSSGVLMSPNIGGAATPGGLSFGVSGNASGSPVNVRELFDPATGQIRSSTSRDSFGGYGGTPSYGSMFGRSSAMMGR